jgi:hypothetical protein
MPRARSTIHNNLRMNPPEEFTRDVSHWKLLQNSLTLDRDRNGLLQEGQDGKILGVGKQTFDSPLRGELIHLCI